jgi:hypothetical protein
MSKLKCQVKGCGYDLVLIKTEIIGGVGTGMAILCPNHYTILDHSEWMSERFGWREDVAPDHLPRRTACCA